MAKGITNERKKESLPYVNLTTAVTFKYTSQKIIHLLR